VLVFEYRSGLSVAYQGFLPTKAALLYVSKLVVLLGGPQGVTTDSFDTAGQCTFGHCHSVFLITLHLVVARKKMVEFDHERMELATPANDSACELLRQFGVSFAPDVFHGPANFVEEDIEITAA